jgi:acyl carrier protein
MDENAIYAELTDIFHDVFADDSIVLRPETTAKDVDGWDSFNHLSIIVAVEGRFGIHFGTKEIEELTNIGRMAGLIQQKLTH